MTTQLTTTGPAAEPERPARGRLKRLVLGRPSDPRWARPALWAVLILAAVLYSWDLGRNGDANAFYAAAVLSGTESTGGRGTGGGAFSDLAHRAGGAGGGRRPGGHLGGCSPRPWAVRSPGSSRSPSSR